MPTSENQSPYAPPRAPIAEGDAGYKRVGLGRVAANNVAVMIGALLPLLVIDYVSVRSGLEKDSVWTSTWVTYAALLLAPAGFFWANFGLLGPAPNVRQFAALTMVAI